MVVITEFVYDPKAKLYVGPKVIRELPKPDLHTHFASIVPEDYIYGKLVQMSPSERARTKGEIGKELSSLASTIGGGWGYIRRFDQIDFERITLEDVRSLMKASREHRSLPMFLMIFPFIQHFIQTEEDLHTIASRFVQDCAEDGIIYTELRLAPTPYTQRGLSPEGVISAVYSGLTEAGKKFGVESRLVITADRHKNGDVEQAIEIARKYKERYGIVGIDIAGVENGFPIKNHANTLEQVKGLGLGITIHAGEDFDPRSIRQAVDYGKADRIGHGTSLIHDPDLLKRFVDEGRHIEACISSNVLTNPGLEFEEHPVKHYAERRVNWSLNTDNRRICNITLTGEYAEAARVFGWDIGMVVKGIFNGFQSAFLPEEEKRNLMQEASERVERLVPNLMSRIL